MQATNETYLESVRELLPTPTKSHYLFNLRDIARVIKGVMMPAGDKIANGEMLCRLWCHETLRVFYDRLVTAEDREWLLQHVREISKKFFSQVGAPQRRVRVGAGVRASRRAWCRTWSRSWGT